MDTDSASASRWECIDFELEIREGGPHEYPVSVRSPAGEAQEEMHFPFDKWELENRLQALEIALLRSGEPRRRIPTENERIVQDFGQGLFQALLVGEVRTRYEMSLREARRQNKGLRLKLHIQPPELARLPWEFLYDSGRDKFLCRSSKTPLVRYLNLPQPVERLAVSPPLKVLGMVASPLGLPQLNVEREKQRVEEATKDLRAEGQMELTWLEGETWRDLRKAMRRGSWHIFHFIGHGGFDPASNEGAIALSDKEGRKQLLRATGLGEILGDHYPLRLVLLNSCEGARGSEGDAFSSNAATLVRWGVPAVVAMQYEITDEAAIAFAQDFYEAVADGLPVDAAVAEARTAVTHSLHNTLEWGTPVLYMRSPDGCIFDISTKAISAEAPPLTTTNEESAERQEEGLLSRYRECVELVWADEQLNRHEAEWLSEYANNRLGLSMSAAAAIDREVMGDTKEAILKGREQAVSEEPHKDHPKAEETKAKQNSFGSSNVEVPDLIGQSRPEARSMLSAIGLKLGSQIKAANEGVPEGRVVNQNPKAGAKAKQGSSVSITVSSGPSTVGASTVEVPDITGLNLARARSKLTGANLKLGDKDKAPSDTVPKGETIKQYPAARTKAKQGSYVKVTVSSGSPIDEFYTVKVQELTGNEQNATDSARKKAQELGVDLSQVEGSGAGGRIIVKDVTSTAQRLPAKAVRARTDITPLGVDRIRVLRKLEGHEASVTSVAFSPDGRLLASGAFDRTVKVWGVGDGALLRTLEGHEASVLSVAFSPNGRLLASGQSDNTVKVWGIA